MKKTIINFNRYFVLYYNYIFNQIFAPVAKAQDEPLTSMKQILTYSITKNQDCKCKIKGK